MCKMLKAKDTVINIHGYVKTGKDILIMSRKKRIKLNMYQIQYIYFEMCRLQHEYRLHHGGDESPLIKSIMESLL